MSFSLFDAKSGEYIGSSRAFIGGHVFTDYVDGYASGGLRIEYSIE